MQFTCPHCREWILTRLSTLRFLGQSEKLKEEQRKYLSMIRIGKWKIEKEGPHAMRIVYCVLPDPNTDGAYCCYHLNDLELRQLFNQPKKDPKHQAVYDRYHVLRDLNLSVKETCNLIEKETGYKVSTIKKIAHTRN